VNPVVDVSLVGATLLGLFGGLHCIGMCGGISASLAGALPQTSTPRGRVLAQFGYNFGRIFSYAVAGALAGGLGLSVLALIGPGGTTALRVLAGLFLVAAGLYLSGWWMGMARVEQIGAKAWRHIAPFARRLGPLDRPWKLVALGAIWGWLPCGLVYAALAGAVAAGGAAEGALWMVCFGLGTLPSLMAAGLAASWLQRITRSKIARQLVGATVILMAVATLVMQTSGHGHMNHQHMAQQDGMHDHTMHMPGDETP